MNRTGRRLAIWGLIIGLNVLIFLIIFSPGQFGPLYEEKCSNCHGKDLTGAPLGPPLVGVNLQHGDTVEAISRVIASGASGMPSFAETLDEAEIQSLAIYVAEQRAGFSQIDLKISTPLVIPDKWIESELHEFRVEPVATGLDPLPFSIAPMPDGRILLTERGKGLSILSQDGTQSALLPGAPTGFDDAIGISFSGLKFGLGWMMDVALHPDYAENGWIYLQYGDRCSRCNEASKNGKDVAMNKLVRGRIKDGRWVDQQTIWQSDKEFYTQTTDMSAGGRIAFDDDGHVFISVGFKAPSNYIGIQDLSTPWGKTHRVLDDGRVPPDNPFANTPKALDSIWTFGHRSPQGLEFNKQTGELWSTEMGPRGGDEVNLLLPGRNYGWPLTSKGLNYDGSPVAYGTQLGLSVDALDIEQPVIDLTPSPAVSSFIIYEGDAFPKWRQNLIVGSLKATTLYRMVLKDGVLIHRETLLGELGRIRDVDLDTEGNIYLLLEHAKGSKVVRLTTD